MVNYPRYLQTKTLGPKKRVCQLHPGTLNQYQFKMVLPPVLQDIAPKKLGADLKPSNFNYQNLFGF